MSHADPQKPGRDDIEVMAEALADRIDRFQTGGDVAAVLDPAAVSDAEALFELCERVVGAVTIGVAHLVASLHYARAHAAGPPYGQEDLAEAVRLFEGLLRVAPEAVPPEVLTLLLADLDPGTDPDVSERVGEVLRVRAYHRGDQRAYDQAVTLLRAAVDGTPLDDPARAVRQGTLAAALQLRFEWLRNRADVEEAIALNRLCLATTEADNPRRAGYLDMLGNGLRTLAGATDSTEEGAEAIRFGLEAVAVASAAELKPSQQAMYLFNLSIDYLEQFTRTQDRDDLDGAIRYGRRSIEFSEPDDPFLPARRSSLSTALVFRWQEGEGELADLGEALDLGRTAIAAAAPGSQDRAIALNNQVLGLLDWAERVGTDEAFDEAVDVARSSVEAAEAPAKALYHLHQALVRRFNHSGGEVDLDEAIDVGRAALDHLPVGSRLREETLRSFGGAVEVRLARRSLDVDVDHAVFVAGELRRELRPNDPAFVAASMHLTRVLLRRIRRTPDLADVDAAILAAVQTVAVLLVAVGRFAVGRAPRAILPDSAEPSAEGLPRTTALLAAVEGFQETHQLDGRAEFLDLAIDLLRTVIDLPAVPFGTDPVLWGNFGQMLVERYGREGSLADLDDAIAADRRAVAASDGESRTDRLGNLLLDLCERARRTDRVADAEEAVELGGQAVDPAVDTAGQTTLTVRLADALRLRSHLGGERADLDEAVALLERWRECRAGGADDRVNHLLGALFEERFAVAGNHDDLARRVALWRTVADEQTGRAEALIELGRALEDRFRMVGEAADGTAAVDVMRSARSAVASDDPKRADMFGRIAAVLLDQYRRMQDPTLIDEAIAANRQALDAAADDERPTAWSELGNALRIRFQAGANPDDIAEAVAVGQRAVDEAAPDDPAFRDYTSNLGLAFMRRYLAGGDRADLDASVDAFRRSLAATPPGHPALAGTLSDLGITLAMQADHVGAATADEAVALMRHAVEATPDDDPALAGRRGNLIVALQTRSDLAEAVELAREAVAGGGSAATRVEALIRLSSVLRKRFLAAGAPDDLDEALAVARQAVDDAPTDELRRDARRVLRDALRSLVGAGAFERIDELVDACEALHAEGRIDMHRLDDVRIFISAILMQDGLGVGRAADIDRAVALARSCADGLDADHPRRAAWLRQVVRTLSARFARSEDIADIDAAVAAGRAAVALHGAGDPRQVPTLELLSVALRQRFNRTGDRADIEAAVQAAQDAVALLPPPDAPDVPEAAGPGDDDDVFDPLPVLTDLCLALRVRAEFGGNPADLDVAIDVGEAALRTADEHHIDYGGALAAVANARRKRFDHRGDLADLDRAVDLLRRATRAQRIGSAAGSLFNNLGTALWLRSDRTGSRADRDEAVEVARQAVTVTPPRHAAYARRLSNLGMALMHRYSRDRRPEDIHESAAVARQAAAVTPTDHPERAKTLAALAGALSEVASLTGSAADDEEAVAIARASVEATPPDDSERTVRLHMLGQILSRDTGAADLDAARHAFAEAAQHLPGRPMVRALAGKEWAELAVAASDWPEAERAWSTVLSLLPIVADAALDRSDRQHRLRLLQGIGPGAAVTAIHRGDLGAAWAALEQGRGILLAQAIESRVDTGELAAAHPGLAEEVRRLRTVLNLDPAADPDTNEAAGAVTAERRRAFDEWNTLLATIRAQPGFDRFALPLAAEQVKAVAGAGSIVALLPDVDEGHALIARGHGLDHLVLPKMTLSTAVDAAAALLGATADAAEAATETVAEVLAWLWAAVAEPVLDRLGFRDVPGPGAPWPHIWWIPTGPISILPIHAAGQVDIETGSPARSVLDRAVSSYAPTVRALHYAQRRERRPATAPLVVGIDDAPGYRRLRWAAQEAALVTAALDVPSPALINGQATTDAVLRKLVDTDWAHFACHAVLQPDPSDSHMVLADGSLTVRRIGALDVRGAYFAYLSACTTAHGGVSLLDESVHVASAFQLAGFQHVIGTLWPVSDVVAPEFARAAYHHLTRGAEPALAAHEATREVRADYLEVPYLWAAHVHFGP